MAPAPPHDIRSSVSIHAAGVVPRYLQPFFLLFSCCCSLTNHSRAGGCAGGNYPFLTQKERDVETGLDYFLARNYSPTQARFTSPDEFTGRPDELFDFAETAADNPTFYSAIEEPQSLNKYQYCFNNPLSYVDPDGHAPKDEPMLPGDFDDPIKAYVELKKWHESVFGRDRDEPWVVKARGYKPLPRRPRPNHGGNRKRANSGRGDGSWKHGAVTVMGNWSVGRDARPRPIPGGWNHNHHIFPQRSDLAARFSRLGININDFLMVLPRGVHTELHRGGARGGAWNREWETFFRANPNATKPQVFQHLIKLIEKYNLRRYPVVPK